MLADTRTHPCDTTDVAISVVTFATGNDPTGTVDDRDEEDGIDPPSSVQNVAFAPTPVPLVAAAATAVCDGTTPGAKKEAAVLSKGGSTDGDVPFASVKVGIVTWSVVD